MPVKHPIIELNNSVFFTTMTPVSYTHLDVYKRQVSDNPEEKYYFDSYEDTQFAILSVFRFRAPINEGPDYNVYHNGKLFEIVLGDMLFNMYVENGGHVYEDCLNKENDKKEDESVEDLSKTIEDTTNSLKNLLNSIEKLNNML